MIDLKKLPVGTKIKTRKGFVWTLEKRYKNGDYWRDETSKLVWHPDIKGKFTHYQAMELEDSKRRLPTKEEFKAAEKHGIREIIFELTMGCRWSASVHQILTDDAYFFYGVYGDIGYGRRDSGNGSVRCVSR